MPARFATRYARVQALTTLVCQHGRATRCLLIPAEQPLRFSDATPSPFSHIATSDVAVYRAFFHFPEIDMPPDERLLAHADAYHASGAGDYRLRQARRSACRHPRAVLPARLMQSCRRHFSLDLFARRRFSDYTSRYATAYS